MRTQSSDTNPKVEKILIKMLQGKTISQRISKSLSLTSDAFYLSKRAISRANPDKNQSELDILFVQYHYGNKLANQLKKYLQEEKMNKSEITLAIEPLIHAFEEIGISYYICGSIASSAYGVSRTTQDIDFVSDILKHRLKFLLSN